MPKWSSGPFSSGERTWDLFKAGSSAWTGCSGIPVLVGSEHAQPPPCLYGSVLFDPRSTRWMRVWLSCSMSALCRLQQDVCLSSGEQLLEMRSTRREGQAPLRFAVHVSLVLEPCWIHPQLNTECFSGKRFFFVQGVLLSALEVLRRNLMAGIYIRLWDDLSWPYPIQFKMQSVKTKCRAATGTTKAFW